MSIAGHKARKSTNTASPRRQTSRRQSSFKRNKASLFVRVLSRVPRWFLWVGGIGVALLYVLFILQVVLHFSMPWQAIFGEAPEPEGYTVRGVDISHYQNRIDWGTLKQATIQNQPVRFVIMKATEGRTIRDNTFRENFKQAHANDFIVGAYHFFVPASDSQQQADNYIRNVKLQNGDLPPILDVEKAGRLSTEKLQEAVRTWLNTIEKHYGVRPIIYTYYKFKMQYLNTPEFDAYPFWIAHYYKDELEYKGDWVFWQYTDCGVVPGIGGRVDCNVFNGDFDQLLDLCITGQ